VNATRKIKDGANSQAANPLTPIGRRARPAASGKAMGSAVWVKATSGRVRPAF
jgi:hypothetical protein